MYVLLSIFDRIDNKINIAVPLPTSNLVKIVPSIMLYNAYFALKFGWISIKFERVIHDSQ